MNGYNDADGFGKLGDCPPAVVTMNMNCEDAAVGQRQSRVDATAG